MEDGFHHQPPIPLSMSGDEWDGFAQTIRLSEGGKMLAIARWHASAREQGVVQLVELTVHPSHCRRGLGSALLNEVLQQAIVLHQLKKLRLRRIWVSIEQKTQVIARAFVTRHGFHHTATIKDLLDHQDALIYVRTFD
jgi:GNAT superfamily N-acetyltransferase